MEEWSIWNPDILCSNSGPANWELKKYKLWLSNNNCNHVVGRIHVYKKWTEMKHYAVEGGDFGQTPNRMQESKMEGVHLKI